MIIRVSAKEGEIQGDPSGLRDLSISVSNFLATAGDEYVVPVNGDVDPSPYDRVLKRILFKKTDGPAKVSVEDDSLVVSGSVDNLNQFLSFVEIQQLGYHTHFEFIEGNAFIDSRSFPLVVSCCEG